MGEIFSVNKQAVRMINLKFIKRIFSSRENDLVYFGMPSAEMKDVLTWKKYLKKIFAVELGKEGQEFVRQHNLMITAFKEGLHEKIVLLRGDIDSILIKKADIYGNHLVYPFDLVVLDYCGGIVYTVPEAAKAPRLNAISQLFKDQADYKKDFILFLSVNMDHDHHEINKALESLRPVLEKSYGKTQIIDEFKASPYEEVRLKVYVLYIISCYASHYYKIEYNKPIHYEGNKGTRMMNFSFFFKYNNVSYAPRAIDLKKIINKDLLMVHEGKIDDSTITFPIIS